MLKMAVRNQRVDQNPAADFERANAAGTESPRERFLPPLAEIEQLASSMRKTENFGRESELAVWLLLALCVRKTGLLPARVEDCDLEARMRHLKRENTKTSSGIDIPLPEPLTAWLKEAIAPSCGKPYCAPMPRHTSTMAPRQMTTI